MRIRLLEQLRSARLPAMLEEDVQLRFQKVTDLRKLEQRSFSNSSLDQLLKDLEDLMRNAKGLFECLEGLPKKYHLIEFLKRVLEPNMPQTIFSTYVEPPIHSIEKWLRQGWGESSSNCTL